MDFDAFDDTSMAAAAPSGDVEEFLRREQAAFGDEFGNAAPATHAPVSAGLEDDPFEINDAAPAEVATGALNDEADPFGQADTAAAEPVDGEQIFYVSQQAEYVDPYAALAQVNETPQPIQEWRAKRESQLEAKDKASKDKTKQMEADAKAAIEKFNKEYQAQKDATRKKNRDAQQATIQSRDAPTKGNTWERVYNLVDLTPKGQKSIKDVARIRTVLTQLKTDVRAPGSA